MSHAMCECDIIKFTHIQMLKLKNSKWIPEQPERT